MDRKIKQILSAAWILTVLVEKCDKHIGTNQFGQPAFLNKGFSSQLDFIAYSQSFGDHSSTGLVGHNNDLSLLAIIAALKRESNRKG